MAWMLVGGRLMYTLESPIPRRGLSVPALTICDAQGAVLEAEQRALIRYLINDGYGCDIIFCNGTTGEWNRLSAAARERVTEITCDVVVQERARLAEHRPVLAWVGITGRTVAECLQHLRRAIACGADGVVLAPLSVTDSPGVLRLLQGPITDCMDDAGRHVPLLLYDNAAIEADGVPPHLRTRDVKRLSRLNYVVGINVSASTRVLGNYTRGARHFNERHAFAVYVGNAFDIFPSSDLGRGWWGPCGIIGGDTGSRPAGLMASSVDTPTSCRGSGSGPGSPASVGKSRPWRPCSRPWARSGRRCVSWTAAPHTSAPLPA